MNVYLHDPPNLKVVWKKSLISDKTKIREEVKMYKKDIDNDILKNNSYSAKS